MARDNEIVETFVDVAVAAMVPAGTRSGPADTSIAMVKVIDILNTLKPADVQRVLRAAGAFFGYEEDAL